MSGQSPKITKDTEVSTTELAAVLGLTARRIQQMAQDGTLPTCSPGRFCLADSVRRYMDFTANKKRSSQDQQLELERAKAETDIKVSKAKILQAEAEEIQGNMHRSEDVQTMTEDLIYTIRGALNAMPGRLAVDVVTTSNAAEASAMIRREVNKVLEELAAYRYDPKKYQERVRARLDWSEADDEE